jgi:hypothetical protein
MKFDEFIIKYNDRIDELNHAKLIIRELKVELRARDLARNISENVSANLNTSLSTSEEEVLISTSKKLSGSSVFADDKDSIIDD